MYNYEEEEDIDYGISAEPAEAFQINRELNIARRIAEETGANLFLTGKAGTGKTTFLHRLRLDSRKRMVVLAPTGVAAINASGMTIHSFFQLPFSPFIPGQGFAGEGNRFFRFSKEKRRLIASVDLIVIDEISMVRPDTLDAIDSVLRRFRNPLLPFGGVQLLLIGDLRQLAPVVRGDEWSLLSPYYASPYFFESKALKEAGFYTVELKTIYRQQDPEFISLLNAVRDGMADSSTLQTLNRRCLMQGQPEPDDSVIRLTTHNRIADDRNARKLAALSSPPVVFEAQVKGKFPESSYPADKFLTLKEGARVMFIKNDTGENRLYYNGLLGTVTELTDTEVTVRPDNGEEDIKIGFVEWENTRFDIDETTKEIREIVEGTFSQVPLRLAWAITIHKSQGLTFEAAVIDAASSFAPGQLYVALSRCRNLEGMTLDSTLDSRAVIIDRNVNSFIDESRRLAPGEEDVNRLRDEYFRALLRELFNFRTLHTTFSDFSRCVLSYIAPTYPELFNLYSDAEKEMRTKITDVGEKFINIYTSRRLDADHTQGNEAFNEKIAGGCKYFLEQLQKVADLANGTSLSLDNKEYARQTFRAADAFRFELHLKRAILNGLLEENFNPNSYMRLKALAMLDFEENDFSTPKVKKTSKSHASRQPQQPQSPRKKEKKEKKPKGYSQRESLRLWREGKKIAQIAEERGLAATTIAGHLAEMASLGEIALCDILPVDIKKELDSLKAAKPDINYSVLREQAPAHISPEYISIYYKLFFKEA